MISEEEILLYQIGPLSALTKRLRELSQKFVDHITNDAYQDHLELRDQIFTLRNIWLKRMNRHKEIIEIPED